MRAGVRIESHAVSFPVTCHLAPCLPVPFPLFLRVPLIKISGGYALISSNAPVSESMINPRTTISLGTSGWVLMVSTVLRTDSGVSLKPSNQRKQQGLVPVPLHKRVGRFDSLLRTVYDTYQSLGIRPLASLVGQLFLRIPSMEKAFASLVKVKNFVVNC